jgi:hypothetical protein
MDAGSYYASMLMDPPEARAWRMDGEDGSYYASMLLDPPEARAWRMDGEDGDVETPLWSHS